MPSNGFLRYRLVGNWVLVQCLLLTATSAWGQLATQSPTAITVERDPRGPSVDGLYWVEVEVSIFSSQYGNEPFSEVAVSPRNNLNYLPQLRPLLESATSYSFPFAPLLPDATNDQLVVAPLATNAVSPSVAIAAPMIEGPKFSPAQADAFKILDLERDPFVALDRRFWRFNQLNARLEAGNAHKVLWHQVWRQPLLPRSQTPALQIAGGSEFGNHYELEGSLRLSGKNQTQIAELDANLWLSNFSAGDASSNLPNEPNEWTLPERPPLDISATVDPTTVPKSPINWYPSKVWQLNQNRDVGPNALYYLDHPAMGVLIEIRPYLMPPLLVPATTTPAPTNAQKFE